MMKVLLINGSQHIDGCVFTALKESAKVLEKEGIETEIYHIGTGPVRGCIACGSCKSRTIGRCAFDDDPCNEMAEKIAGADGLIVGSPVFYAGPSGALCALLERAVFSTEDQRLFENKPVSVIVNARRSGTTAAFDRLYKYFSKANMVIIGSQYWNGTHGNSVEDILQDAEGLQTCRTIGQNMAWVLKALEGTTPPVREKIVRTNFIQ